MGKKLLLRQIACVRLQNVKKDDDDVESKAHRAKHDAKGKAEEAGGWFSRKSHQAKDATGDAGHSAHHGLHKAAVRFLCRCLPLETRSAKGTCGCLVLISTCYSVWHSLDDFASLNTKACPRLIGTCWDAGQGQSQGRPGRERPEGCWPPGVGQGRHHRSGPVLTFASQAYTQELDVCLYSLSVALCAHVKRHISAHSRESFMRCVSLEGNRPECKLRALLMLGVVRERRCPRRETT